MAAVALNYFSDNFIKIHSTRRTSPAMAMAAGVTDRLWDVADLVDLLIEAESKKAAQLATSARQCSHALRDNTPQRRRSVHDRGPALPAAQRIPRSCPG